MNYNVYSLKCFYSISKLVRQYDWQIVSVGNQTKYSFRLFFSLFNFEHLLFFLCCSQTFDHQDVHELNRLLFDAIQKSLQGTKQSNLIRSCYEGTTTNYTQCKRCENIFKRTVRSIENKCWKNKKLLNILFDFKRKIIKIYH